MFRTEECQFDYFTIHRVHIKLQCNRWTIKNSYDFKVNFLGTLGNSFAIFHYLHETNNMNKIDADNECQCHFTSKDPATSKFYC